MPLFSSRIDAAFHQAIMAKTFSGAQLLLGQGHAIRFAKAYGRTSFFTEAHPVDLDTLFDIASLTKVVCTTTLCMLAVETKRLELHAPLAAFFPGWQRSDPITIEHLLGHTSGLPAWLPFYEPFAGQPTAPEIVRAHILSEIQQTPAAAPLGSQRIYSDLNFLLLGFILEKIYAMPLDQLFTQEIAQALGMQATAYRTIGEAGKLEPSNLASTEALPRTGAKIAGLVHDDNTYALGGVAGHAGLFSQVMDLAKFCRFMLEVSLGENAHISQNTYRRFVSPEKKFRLGWDQADPPFSQAGQYFSAASIGHLAFTGCSLWIDPEDQKYVVLLTNRVHPNDEDARPIKRFRPMIHNLLVEEAGLKPA